MAGAATHMRLRANGTTMAGFAAATRRGYGRRREGGCGDQLRHHRPEAARRALHDLLAGDVRTGERHLIDIAVGRQCRTRGFAEAGDDIDHARRHTGLLAQLGQASGVNGATVSIQLPLMNRRLGLPVRHG